MLKNRDYLEPRQGLRNDPTPGVSPTWPCRAEKILDFLVPEHQNRPCKKLSASFIELERPKPLDWPRPELRAAGAQISYRNFIFLSPNFTIFLENFLRAARNLMQNETQTLYIPTIYGKTWHLILCKYIHTRRDHNAEEALFGVRAQSRRVSAKRVRNTVLEA